VFILGKVTKPRERADVILLKVPSPAAKQTPISPTLGSSARNNNALFHPTYALDESPEANSGQRGTLGHDLFHCGPAPKVDETHPMAQETTPYGRHPKRIHPTNLLWNPPPRPSIRLSTALASPRPNTGDSPRAPTKTTQDYQV
jgi:hypothetical protein